MRSTLVGAVLVAAAAAGCSAPADDPAPPSPDASEPSAQPPAEPLAWGEAAEVTGANGTPVELAPVAVRYVDSGEITSPTDSDYPAQGMFAAVRIEASAAEAAETLSWPVDGGGWGWRQDGQQYSTGDGNAVTAPWVGSVPEFTSDAQFLPGEDPTVGYETFDLAEPGGHLAYTDSAGVLVRWEAPTDSTGDVPEVQELLDAQ